MIESSGIIVVNGWPSLSDLIQSACGLSDNHSAPYGTAEFEYTGGGTVRLKICVDFVQSLPMLNFDAKFASLAEASNGAILSLKPATLQDEPPRSIPLTSRVSVQRKVPRRIGATRRKSSAPRIPLK